MFHTNGHVIDFLFIDFGGPFRTGVFNLADVEIVVGVLLLLLKLFFKPFSEFSKIKHGLINLGPDVLELLVQHLALRLSVPKQLDLLQWEVQSEFH